MSSRAEPEGASSVPRKHQFTKEERDLVAATRAHWLRTPASEWEAAGSWWNEDWSEAAILDRWRARARWARQFVRQADPEAEDPEAREHLVEHPESLTFTRLLACVGVGQYASHESLLPIYEDAAETDFPWNAVEPHRLEHAHRVLFVHRLLADPDLLFEEQPYQGTMSREWAYAALMGRHRERWHRLVQDSFEALESKWSGEALREESSQGQGFPRAAEADGSAPAHLDPDAVADALARKLAEKGLGWGGMNEDARVESAKRLDPKATSIRHLARLLAAEHSTTESVCYSWLQRLQKRKRPDWLAATEHARGANTVT